MSTKKIQLTGMDVLHTPTSFLDDLLVVLVLYKMEIDTSPAFISLTKAAPWPGQKISIFIYDNSPSALAPQPQIENWSIVYKSDPANAGVSKAYNEGLKIAKTQNKKWILLADQDTEFPHDFFEQLLKAVSTNPNAELFTPIIKSGQAFISPFRFRFGRGVAFHTIVAETHSLRDSRFINSGLMISTALFEECGGYDERFYLDFSDLAFIERLKIRSDTFIVINATCSHSLSSEEQDLGRSLERFRHFVNASRFFGEVFDRSFYLRASRFMRAAKLSFRFRSLQFVKVLLSNG